MNNLGLRIKFLRNRENLTQHEFGNIVGLHGSNVGRIENGKVYPTSDIIFKIAVYFNVSCDWLLMGENANLQISTDSIENRFLNSFKMLDIDEQNEIIKIIDIKLEKLNKKS